MAGPLTGNLSRSLDLVYGESILNTPRQHSGSAAADLQPFGPGRRGTGSATPWLRRQWHAYGKAMLSQCDGNGHGNVTAT